MIGLDTNILVRYFVQDEPKQARVASDLIEKSGKIGEIFYLNVIVLCELVWVLESLYKIKKKDIVNLLDAIFFTSQFEIESRDEVRKVFDDFKNANMDFADCLIGVLNKKSGCIKTLTFDKGTKGSAHFEILT